MEGDFTNILNDEHMRDVRDTSFELLDFAKINDESGGTQDAKTL